MIEEWKPIFNSHYSVSSMGRIKNIDTGKILKPRVHSNGYLRTCINGKDKYIHRLVAEYFIGNNSPDVKNTVNHKDFDKKNNCVENLEWISKDGNYRHAVENKRNAHSSRHGHTILSEETVIEIRRLKNTGLSASKIKEALNLSYRADSINHIASGTRWIHA